MEIRAINNIVMVLLAYVVLMVPAFAYAAQGDAQMQVKTAEQHATFATKAGDVAQTHLHLHHVINCLVGPNGEGFDAKAGNPCQGQGNGALNDMTGSMQEKDTLKQALALAKIGVTIQDHKPANYTAMAVKALLEEATQDK
jgi:hypothetical protein